MKIFKNGTWVKVTVQSVYINSLSKEDLVYGKILFSDRPRNWTKERHYIVDLSVFNTVTRIHKDKLGVTSVPSSVLSNLSEVELLWLNL